MKSFALTLAALLVAMGAAQADNKSASTDPKDQKVGVQAEVEAAPGSDVDVDIKVDQPEKK